VKPAVYKRFEELRGLLQQHSIRGALPEAKPSPSKEILPEGLNDEELFRYSMRNITSLGWSSASTPSSALPVEIYNPQESEDEGLRLLTEFVMGKGTVDLMSSGEYIEGTPHPDGRFLVDHLRAGRFSVQAHLDLHGLNAEEARVSLFRFVRFSLMRGFGCVRIIHGRGHNSTEGQPTLKEHLQKWLNSRRMSRHVMAYTSARLSDGGGGAVYVLLRRRLAKTAGTPQAGRPPKVPIAGQPATPLQH
jgi:DNA-nicking Smr family endonuclease